MLKKRLIFTLLYSKGNFMLSRNFRLQKVGNVGWLNMNYNFNTIATSIDELIILNTERAENGTTLSHDAFLSDVEKVTKGCFMPLALGGGLTSVEQIPQLMYGGADKIVVNTALFHNPGFVRAAVAKYGSQCIVASIDYRITPKGFVIYTACGNEPVEGAFGALLAAVADLGVGEIYLNSMDKDGTGQGYCMDVLNEIRAIEHLPVIMAGGAGNFEHLKQGLDSRNIDAVATANLFNFVGDGLPKAREKLLAHELNLARW